MIDEINIKNIATIKEASIPLCKGLNVLTGETGAGKTMVLNAFNLLSGGRVNSSLIKSGTDFLYVEGQWNINDVPAIKDSIESLNGEVENGVFYINRKVLKDSKNKIMVGGSSINSSALNLLSDQLIKIHGQSEQVFLRNNEVQKAKVDSFAKLEALEEFKNYQTAFQEYNELISKLENLKKTSFERSYEIEFLTNAVKEIDEVSPQDGEYEEVLNKINTLSHLEEIYNSLVPVLKNFDGDDYESKGIIELISMSSDSLEKVAPYANELSDIAKRMEELSLSLGELNNDLARYANGIDMDSLEELNYLYGRKNDLDRIIKKFGTNLADVIEFHEASKAKLDDLSPENNDEESLLLLISTKEDSLRQLSDVITKTRVAAAANMESMINNELSSLAMGGTKFIINVSSSDKYLKDGKDAIEFLVHNKGMSAPMPIGKVSSGGELSRILLALEVVSVNDGDGVTLIFDEIDSGVGGATALEIGKRLKKLSLNNQVLVVTHLPQVAAFADNHLVVVKKETDTDTETYVKTVSEDERIDEISRMLSGVATDSSREHAAELLSLRHK
jgi:DNA repair protein RecN (Recombination protein N)